MWSWSPAHSNSLTLMSRPPKRKVSSQGRVTPKGGPSASKRYTPPIPEEVKNSPRWLPVVMFTLLGLGVLMILLNYVGVLPGATNNWYLLGGLGLILAGIITATRWH